LVLSRLGNCLHLKVRLYWRGRWYEARWIDLAPLKAQPATLVELGFVTGQWSIALRRALCTAVWLLIAAKPTRAK